jgi:hypothetical protein
VYSVIRRFRPLAPHACGYGKCAGAARQIVLLNRARMLIETSRLTIEQIHRLAKKTPRLCGG